MGDIKGFDDPLWRQGAGKLGELQRLFADKLVSYDSPLAFLPYFLTGGHDTADALDRIKEQGIARPLSRTNPDTGKRENPRMEALLDALGASQVGIYGSAGVGADKFGASKLNQLYKKLLEVPFNEGRREALKKGSAVSGQAVIPTPLKIAAAAAGGGVLAKAAPEIVAEVAKKFKYNSLAEYLAAIKKAAKEDALDTFRQGESPDALNHALQSGDFDHYIADDLAETMKQQLQAHEELYAVVKEVDTVYNKGGAGEGILTTPEKHGADFLYEKH